MYTTQVEVDIEVHVQDQHGNPIPFDVDGSYNITITIDTTDKEVFRAMREQIRKEVGEEITQRLFTDIPR